MEQEPVRFFVKLENGADFQEIKQVLESLSDRIQIHILQLKTLELTYMFGETDQETYEQVFSAELKYITRTIQNINHGPREVQEWVEVRSAKVPKGLEGKIKLIRLDQPHYLTD